MLLDVVKDLRYEFPSPTGVNYYEWVDDLRELVFDEISFRPQQGLTIMNNISVNLVSRKHYTSFRPQQGLTIMNRL